MKNTKYPKNWLEITTLKKAAAGWKCESCGHIHDSFNGYTLTVHHIDGNTENNEEYNLVVLCQRCHLRVQNKIFLGQLNLYNNETWIQKKWKEYQDYAKPKEQTL